MWERVRALFFRYFPGDTVPEVEWKKPDPVSCDGEMLAKQGVGCLKSVVAKCYGKQEREAVRRYMHTLVDRYFAPAYEKYHALVNRVEILTGLRLGQEGCRAPVVSPDGKLQEFVEGNGNYYGMGRRFPLRQ